VRADNSHHVVAAAHRRSQAARHRAMAALRRMDDTGRAVTVDALAREAGVSRSWLYTQPDLRAEVDRLRARARPTRTVLPDRQRSTDASLQRRLEVATARVRELDAENQRLRRDLAEALGHNRADRTDRPGHDTPERPRTSKIIGPC
jgi:Family of unknown function (DUF6262)